MKKICFIFALMLLPIASSAVDVIVEIDGIYYSIVTKGKVATVTSNPNKYSGEVIIPDIVTYDDKECNVIAIGERAFYGSSDLTSITIPNSVTSIGEKSFTDCSGLTSITFPNSVTSIGYATFGYCI